MKNLALLSLFLLVILACDKNTICINPSGTITQTYYSPGAFDNIILRGDADLIIRFDSAGYYWGSASDNVLPLWEFEVQNGNLIIEPEGNTCFNGSDAVFHIYHPNLESLRIEGYSLVQIANLHQDNLLLNVLGVSNIRIDSSSFQRLDVIYQGTGDLFAYDAPSDTVEINITGQADAQVTVSDLLRVFIEGTGTIRYDGMPVIEQQITGSGSINPR